MGWPLRVLVLVVWLAASARGQRGVRGQRRSSFRQWIRVDIRAHKGMRSEYVHQTVEYGREA